MQSINFSPEVWDDLVDLWEKAFYAKTSSIALAPETKEAQLGYDKLLQAEFRKLNPEISYQEFVGLVAYEVDCRLKQSRKARRF